MSRALDELGPRGAKQRSVVLADLAAAHSDDPDRTANYLNQAVDALHASWYGTGLDRIRAVRALLADSRHGRDLDDRLASLQG